MDGVAVSEKSVSLLARVGEWFGIENASCVDDMAWSLLIELLPVFPIIVC